MKTKITLKSLYLLLFTLLLSTSIYAQCDIDNIEGDGPYRVATLKESDGIRNGPDYTDATVYYPTDASGTYGSIVLVPGFTNQSSAIASWGPFYASHGIIAFIVNVNSPYNQPDARSNAMLDAIKTLKQENTRSGSPLRGKIDTSRFAVSGYSMGGGGAQIAATKDTSIKAVIGLNPWLPSSGVLSGNTSATLILSGESDTTASPVEHANPQYNSTPNSTNKALFEINNGSHNSAQLPERSNGNVGKMALAWLKVYLEDNSCYCDILKDEVLINSSLSSDLKTNFTCETLSNDEFKLDTVSIFPNPASSFVSVKNGKFTKPMDYRVVTIQGQLLTEGKITSSEQKIDLSNLASGMYILNIEDTAFKIVKTN